MSSTMKGHWKGEVQSGRAHSGAHRMQQHAALEREDSGTGFVKGTVSKDGGASEDTGCTSGQRSAPV